MGIRALVAGAAASVVVMAAVSVAAITGLLPDSNAAKVPARSAAAEPTGCAHCGVIVRVLEMESSRYHTEVRMEDGSIRTISSAVRPEWKPGQAVHVRGGKLAAAS